MGSRVLRPERNGSEIGTPWAFRIQFDGCALSTSEVVLFESWTTIVFNWLIKPVKCVVLRLRDVYVRAFFEGLLDLSSLNDRFFNFTLFYIIFLVYIHYIFNSPIFYLCFAASMAFYAC